MRIYTIRAWLGSEEEWFGEFKSPREIHSYLVKNGWTAERPKEKPRLGSSYKKEVNAKEVSVCIGILTRHFKKFDKLTKGTRK